MANSFHIQSDFNANFGKEMVSSTSVYDQRRKSGMKDYSLAVYDFIFISDAHEKLKLLGDFLSSNYNYQIKEIALGNGHYELTGDSTQFPVDEENLMYWALDLYCKGYEGSCGKVVGLKPTHRY
ncbi:hypothetical protein [Mucilaginibacter sp. L3T2-6]|uniref:hypothetical protein n=1 Tax=Mucilaginibacter sp. L3T2-6 TaxID=3062491 RepID=UPI00267476AE|nr:hypothetical protein [Mucilaginibacter sp. L3T2-6]MDO3644451.1 hypothetical protein [Mucilaginibacter sp. L3T2-6]MDV6216903.1 hypothetical protein [Mucilaginibacter sp. L3T2-6]